MSNHKVTPRLIGASLCVGVFSGLFATAYRWVLENIDAFRTHLLLQGHGLSLLFILLLFFVLAYAMHRLLLWAPYSGGSGIPQIRAELWDRIEMDPAPTMISKFVGGSFGNIAGLTLGREGPSIQLGGMVGKILSHLFQGSAEEKKALITSGASAGLAAAFNAPLSGALFALEEMHKSFSPFLLIPCFCAALAANAVSFFLLGMEPAFDFRIFNTLAFSSLVWSLPLGVGMGLLGCVFSKGLLLATRKLPRLPIPRYLLIFLLMVLVFGVGQWNPSVPGGGHGLIEHLVGGQGDHEVILLLGLRLLLVWLCYGSGAQGGIFLPILTVGALGGFLFHQLFSSLWGGLDPALLIFFLYLGMVGVLTAVVQSPVMCILLVTEMSGSITMLLPFATCAIIAYVLARFVGVHPVYEDLYENRFGSETAEQ